MLFFRIRIYYNLTQGNSQEKDMMYSLHIFTRVANNFCRLISAKVISDMCDVLDILRRLFYTIFVAANNIPSTAFHHKNPSQMSCLRPTSSSINSPNKIYCGKKIHLLRRHRQLQKLICLFCNVLIYNRLAVFHTIRKFRVDNIKCCNADHILCQSLLIKFKIESKSLPIDTHVHDRKQTFKSRRCTLWVDGRMEGWIRVMMIIIRVGRGTQYHLHYSNGMELGTAECIYVSLVCMGTVRPAEEGLKIRGH